ncbi:MAG: hypothetical protein MJ124_02440 [Lachnospiraceae bacterium]|nr:hypothetical protein [Lachnospiraceae bacterium]
MKKTAAIVFIAAILFLTACGAKEGNAELQYAPTGTSVATTEPAKGPEAAVTEPTKEPETEANDPVVEPVQQESVAETYVLENNKDGNSGYADFVFIHLNEDKTCSVNLPLSSNSKDYISGRYETRENTVVLHLNGYSDVYFDKEDDTLIFNLESTGKSNITDRITLSKNAKFRKVIDWDVAGKAGFEEQTILGGLIAFEAQVVRTNGYVDGAKYPKSVVITSRAELDEYYNQNKNTYNLGTIDSTSVNFIKKCEKYDDAFFAENNLVLILLESGSGSVRYDINSVNKTKDGIMVGINPRMPEVGTADMAEWHVILEISKKDVSKETKIEVSMISSTPKVNESISDGGLKVDIDLKKVLDTKIPVLVESKKAGVNYGKVTHFTYDSKTTGLTRGANILLPADYDATKEYPVLYFLHGIFGDENSIPGDAGNRIAEITANLVADGSIEDIIVVFPNMFAKTNPAAVPAFSAEGVWPYDNFINDLVNDLIPYVEANYSVKKDRDHRGLIGFSMGGRETLYIGTRRSDLFSVIGCIAPAPGVTPGKDGFMTHEGQLSEDELVVLQQDEYPLDLLMVCCGTKDGVVGKFPESYHNILTRNGVEHVWYEVPGADHDNSAIKSGYFNFLVRWGKLMSE